MAVLLLLLIISLALAVGTMRLIDGRLSPRFASDWLPHPYEFALINRRSRRQAQNLAVASALRYLCDFDVLSPSFSSSSVVNPVPVVHTSLDMAIYQTIATGNKKMIGRLRRAPAVVAALNELERELDGRGVIRGKWRRIAMVLGILWLVPVRS